MDRQFSDNYFVSYFVAKDMAKARLTEILHIPLLSTLLLLDFLPYTISLKVPLSWVYNELARCLERYVDIPDKALAM